jgi:hypothetical protein
MTTATTPVDTARLAGRRDLHFQSLDDILAEVDRIANCSRVGTLGNWSAGQIFEHVARVMDRSIDGFDSRLPAILRFILGRTMKSRMLNRPMAAGFKLPEKAGAELIAPATSLEDGLAHIRKAIRRLHTEPARVPSPFLGPLSREEWDRLHCRHAELHFSFLVPGSGAPA